LPRFVGGAVGYAGYDAVRYVERLPHPPVDDRQLPDLCFALYDRMVIFDHINKTVAAVAHAHLPGSSVSEEEAARCYREACARVDRLVERLQQGVADLQLTDIAAAGETWRPHRSNFAPGDFEGAVDKCKEYIKAGDIFQVVLSQRLTTETRARPFDIYRTLRVVNPSPFMFYLKAGPICLVGASPEIMARVEGDLLTIRPLAGTRPRGKTPEEDDRLAAELSADPKERAEHIMLVDLGRNDVGRVALYGSVQLSDVMTVERYSHVMHLCSNVTGRLEPGKTAFDVLRACLPAGTLSGAPKVRAMEIIDELEPHRRGPYGGAVGYVDFTGNMDTCIALRTMVLKGQTAYLQAGAGIVADSVPALEYAETMNKAMSLLKALEIAETQL
jgi:anthranilate synthase component 1